MRRTHREALKLFVVIICVSAPACQQSHKLTAEEARKELGSLNLTYSESSFIESAKNGDTVAVDLFLKAGVDPNVRDPNGRLACDFPDNRENDSLALVIEFQKQLNDLATVSHREKSTTALMAASAMGRSQVVKQLVDAGASTDAMDRIGMTALMYAASRGESASVKVLLDAGANPSWYSPQLKVNVVKVAIDSHDPETISLVGTGERSK